MLARIPVSIYNQLMNQAGQLYRLQRIDTQIDQASSRLEEIDRLLSEDKRLQAAQAACDAAKVRFEKARNGLRSIEHITTEQQVKIEQTNATLYSGMVKNPKELQDLQKEIISLRKHLGTLEDQQLEAMIEFEEAEQAELTSLSLLKKVEAEVIQAKAGLGGERSQLIAKLDNLAQERSAALTPIPPDHLEIYQHIREQKHGIAVTSVEDEACSSCGAQIRASEAQSARIQSKLQYCSSCGRILFAG
jgi:hypothetical protein